MCIRDSPPTVTTQKPLDRRFVDLELEFHASAASGDRNSQACLLYTSDAADDLLCVDLGGRRII